MTRRHSVAPLDPLDVVVQHVPAPDAAGRLARAISLIIAAADHAEGGRERRTPDPERPSQGGGGLRGPEVAYPQPGPGTHSSGKSSTPKAQRKGKHSRRKRPER